MRLLAVASHEYMKMMVYELEQVSNISIITYK